jgi:hypothetical protein
MWQWIRDPELGAFADRVFEKRYEAVLGSASDIIPAALELTFTSTALCGLAKALGVHEEPSVWDLDRRSAVRANLDAIFFHLYGVAEDDVTFILDAFPILAKAEFDSFGRYATKDRVLDAYRKLS